MLVVSTILRVGSAFVVNSGSWSADVQLCSSPLGHDREAETLMGAPDANFMKLIPE